MTGLATVLAMSIAAPAWADGDPNAKAHGPGVRSLSALRKNDDVWVDYSVLDSLSRSRALLIPQDGSRIVSNEGPVVLTPPPGVAPLLIPPPGVSGNKTMLNLNTGVVKLH